MVVLESIVKKVLINGLAVVMKPLLNRENKTNGAYPVMIACYLLTMNVFITFPHYETPSDLTSGKHTIFLTQKSAMQTPLLVVPFRQLL